MAKKSIIPIFIPHLGCPNDCVFCNQRRIAGKIKAPTGDEVREIIKDGLSKYGGGNVQIAYYGGSFTALPPHLQEEYLEKANEFISSGDVCDIRVSTRPDAIDEDVVKRLKRYNVSTVEIGAQSMDDEVLFLSRRGHDADATRKAAKLIKESGFKLVLQVMCGLPGDDADKCRKTAAETAKLSPDAVRIYPVVVLRDTALCDMYERKEYKALTIDSAAEIAADMLEIFEDSKIPAIRIGLNATDELSYGDSVAAGAYHPELGGIVRSRLYLRRAERAIRELESGNDISIAVNPACVSLMVGHKRENMDKLCKLFPGLDIKVEKDGKIPKGEIKIKINA